MRDRHHWLSGWALSVTGPLTLAACVAAEADVPPNPTVSFPEWASVHQQTQPVRVKPPPGWTIDRVEYAVDGGSWKRAALREDGLYSVTLTNLDIGDNALALRVQSSYLSETQTDIYYDTIANVPPNFICDDPAASMLPTPDLLYDNRTEVRTLLGYFGDPSGGHTVTFVIDFVDEEGNAFEVGGSIINYGRSSITAEFAVDQAWCYTGGPGPGGGERFDCDVDYGLSVWVDGVSLCSSNRFGTITNYWER